MTIKTFRKYGLLAALLALVSVAAPLIPALAAPPAMPALGSAVFPIAFHISGAKTATVTNVANWIAPFGARILYATAVATAKSGTHLSAHGRSGLRILNNANIVTQGALHGAKFTGLAVAVPAAGAATETNASAALGTVLAATAQNVTKGQVVSADLVLWGSSPSITDVQYVLWVQRRD
jgi:hypothetical protein